MPPPSLGTYCPLLSFWLSSPRTGQPSPLVWALVQRSRWAVAVSHLNSEPHLKQNTPKKRKKKRKGKEKKERKKGALGGIYGWQTDGNRDLAANQKKSRFLFFLLCVRVGRGMSGLLFPMASLIREGGGRVILPQNSESVKFNIDCVCTLSLCRT